MQPAFVHLEELMPPPGFTFFFGVKCLEVSLPPDLLENGELVAVRELG